MSVFIRPIKFACMFVAALALVGCTELELASHVAKGAPHAQGSFKVGNPYKVDGQWYNPAESYDMTETGIASWYGPGFHGKKTANGERYDMNELTAAHKTLQMPSLVRVTNLENGKSVIVRVNDRGPFSRGRIMDVSSKAADLLDFKRAGTAKVRLQVLSEESRQIAEAAKNGLSTRGYEVAMNQTGQMPGVSSFPSTSYQGAQVPPLQTGDLQTASVPGHVTEGHFYPDPVVRQMPVTPTNIYVQVGSFSDAGNANALTAKLASYGKAGVKDALVNGRQFYRVRFGPIATVDEADRLLSRLGHAGYGDAMTVVD
jgi:rare lipoprotein A